MFCYSCGKEINERAVICLSCGVMVKNVKSFPQSQKSDEGSCGTRGLSDRSRSAIIIAILASVIAIFMTTFACAIVMALTSRWYADFTVYFLIYCGFSILFTIILSKKTESAFLKKFAFATIITTISLLFLFIIILVPMTLIFVGWW